MTSSSPLLDPDRHLPGLGFRQRRDRDLIPADPLVLEHLRRIQDLSTPQKALLPSMENNEMQTFNNALVAMAFLLSGERERAERILDFFAAATKRENEDPFLQNFFYRGEARGFFQYVNRFEENGVAPWHAPAQCDRWMGDLAWLLLACLHHERVSGARRYAELQRLLKDLLVEYFIDFPGGGYVRHGWRQGDRRLHEDHGHHEGNIDCYAVFRLVGEERRAEKIRRWLDTELQQDALPLDLYTWRVLAYGSEAAALLDVPDHDLRYRKTLVVDGKEAMGFFHGASDAENIWLDGTGHIACAYAAVGQVERANFYANQLDAFLIDREVDGVRTRTIPYVANHFGGYDWVYLDRGFVSVCAWYIFAKNRFNPMTLERT